MEGICPDNKKERNVENKSTTLKINEINRLINKNSNKKDLAESKNGLGRYVCLCVKLKNNFKHITAIKLVKVCVLFFCFRQKLVCLNLITRCHPDNNVIQESLFFFVTFVCVCVFLTVRSVFHQLLCILARVHVARIQFSMADVNLW